MTVATLSAASARPRSFIARVLALLDRFAGTDAHSGFGRDLALRHRHFGGF